MSCTVITAITGTALSGAVAVIGMIILLVTADLADASGGSTLRLFSRHLIVAVIPLLLVSAFTLIMKVLPVFA